MLTIEEYKKELSKEIEKLKESKQYKKADEIQKEEYLLSLKLRYIMELDM